MQIRHLGIVFLLAIVQSCAQDATGEQAPVFQEENLEPPQSTSLFHAQKEKILQLKPLNERKKDPKLDALLKTVETIIKQKDLKLLFSLMDEDVTSSYGGGVVGYDGIQETWGGDYENLWNKLSKILELGGSFTNDSTYSIPYQGNLAYEAQKYDDMMVPHGCGMTTHDQTKIYPNPKCLKHQGIEIGRTFAIVDLMSPYYDRTGDIIKMNILGTGIHGYVKSTDFYVSSDYSLVIQKNKQGNWKIIAFAPWD